MGDVDVDFAEVGDGVIKAQLDPVVGKLSMLFILPVLLGLVFMLKSGAEAEKTLLAGYPRGFGSSESMSGHSSRLSPPLPPPTTLLKVDSEAEDEAAATASRFRPRSLSVSSFLIRLKSSMGGSGVGNGSAGNTEAVVIQSLIESTTASSRPGQKWSQPCITRVCFGAGISRVKDSKVWTDVNWSLEPIRNNFGRFGRAAWRPPINFDELPNVKAHNTPAGYAIDIKPMSSGISELTAPVAIEPYE